MFVIGGSLAALGYFVGVGWLWTVGIVLMVTGAVLGLLGQIGRPMTGRRLWY